MIKLKVPDLHCEKCVSRIHQQLEEVHVEHEIDLARKTVSVPENQVDKVREALDALGFACKKPGLLSRLFGK